jgi:hypothetical protein
MDHVGPLGRTDKGHTHILVIMDRFSKWTEIIPVTNVGAKTTWAKFYKRVVARHGSPNTILCDNASSFKGEFAEGCKTHGIGISHGIPYVHSTNGLVERMNRTIEECLRHYVNPALNDWNLHLMNVQYAVNTGKATSTGFSPFKVLRGHEANTSIKNLIPAPYLNLGSEEFKKALNELKMNQKTTLEKATANLKINNDKIATKGASKKKYTLSKGDLVIVKFPKEMVTAKLITKNHGPYSIHALQGLNATLKDANGAIMEDEVHVQFLFKVKAKAILHSAKIPQLALVGTSPGGVHNMKMFRKFLKFPTGRPVYRNDLLNIRMGIYWSQPGAKGWWYGKIASWKSNGHALIKYEIASADGADTYPQDLVGAHAARIDPKSLSRDE